MIHICKEIGFVEILADWAAVAGAITSVVVYCQTLQRDRKLATINKVNEIRCKYPEVDPLPEDGKLQYLREMEFLCTGINEGIYDLNILKRMSGRLFLSQYNNLKPFLQKREENPKAKDAWSEYKSVMEKLNLLYSCKGCKYRKWFCRKCK